MAGNLTNPIVTIIGNLTADPELRFTQSGAAVANFTVAQTPRSYDRQTNQWRDEETIFFRCSIWRDEAEHLAESAEKGTRVMVHGTLKQKNFTDRDGNNRTSIEMEAIEIGLSTKYATGKLTPAKRNNQPQGGGQQGGYQPQGQQQPQGGQGYTTPATPQSNDSDPWAAAPATGDSDPWA